MKQNKAETGEKTHYCCSSDHSHHGVFNDKYCKSIGNTTK